MWLLNREDEICINLSWVEAFLFDDFKHELYKPSCGKVLFSWGNDPLVVIGTIVEELKTYLKILPASRNRLRLFHEFNYEKEKILVDLSEIKVIRYTEFGIIFYRRHVSEIFWQNKEIFRTKADALAKNGEICRANQSEWESLCSEIRSQAAYYPR